ncbi:MAG: hypothetical protein RL701_4909 [Pseudomonadota bacterium]|jgi:spore coat polysaccharide biosynthesis protein SpsF
MSVVIVIQARLASTRLPGKVLLNAAGRPLLEHMLQRVRAAQHAQHVVVATTTDSSDNPIVALCERLEVACFRGHPSNCLDRHIQVGLQTQASALVKIPSDCPLIDPAAIDRVLAAYLASEGRYSYVSNLHPATWPDGNDVEVVAMDALTTAARETTDVFDFEHTTPYIWMRPERFAALNVVWETGLDYSQSERWVVDWIEDYEVVREIIEQLIERHGPLFDVRCILQLLSERPELRHRNAHYRGYSYYATRTQPVSAL